MTKLYAERSCTATMVAVSRGRRHELLVAVTRLFAAAAVAVVVAAVGATFAEVVAQAAVASPQGQELVHRIQSVSHASQPVSGLAGQLPE